ncbi:uncharacterized protein LOC117335102 [Pecten maximus]|uniref:uncharacterized protein LOC117335102 n=1 Tax=Pecten maximus TaxID=6579 RepID=UPI00145819AD|nr:uncharacterized protein LOC117335102 [Pecten maximus]
MAKASITSSGEIFDCPICLEQYQIPRSLPCLHSFCEECLNSYIASQVDNSTDFPCPVCRLSITLPHHNSTLGSGSWAQTFPLNHLIVTLTGGGMENKDNVMCTPCLVRDSSSVNAVYWCNHCCEGLCEKCYTYHQKNKYSSRHKSGPIVESTNVTANTDVDEDCPRHRGKIIEVYCSDHSELCCVVCFATKHRECKHIHCIDDVSEGFNVDDVCLKFTSEMRDIEQVLLSLASVKETNIVKVNEEVKVVTTEITEAVGNAKVKLDSVRDNLICDVKNKYATEKQKLQRQRKRLQAFEKDVKNCCKVMTSVSSGTKRQAFVTFQKIKSQLTSHYHQLVSEMTNDVDLNIKFYEGILLTSLDTIGSVGKVETEEIPSRKTSDVLTQVAIHLDKVANSSCENPTSLINLMNTNVKINKVVRREGVGLEKEVDLAGGTFLHDGRLLIADYSDNRLIQFDDQFHVINTLPVAGQPTDVSLGLDDSDIFVCINEERVVNFSLGTRGDLVPKNEFTTKNSVWSVAAFDSILVTGGGGYIVQTSKDGCEVGKSELRSGDVNSFVAKHDASRTYYYTDGQFIMCNRLGGEAVFRHDAQRSGGGIAVDQEGNAYVGFVNEDKTGGVYQVSHDGRRSRVLVEALSRIIDPYAIIIHRTKPVFIVVSDDEDTLFEVYEFVP